MFDMDLSSQLNLIKLLSTGATVSLKLFFLTLLFALPLGLVVALGGMSKKKLISAPIHFYILIMRGTPLLLQIMFIYFAPSHILPKGFQPDFDRFTAVVIAFSLNYAAYFAEIYRGGIQAIPQGQYEAASVLGFTRTQTFFKIILPQVIKRILAPISNEVITLVKDTALAMVLGVSELFRVAKNETSRTFSTTPLVYAGFFYLAINAAVTKIFHYLEKRLSYYR